MRRIWMVMTAAAIGLAPRTAPAQQNPPSLAERLAFFTSSDDDEITPAVRQTAGTSPRAPRDMRNSGQRSGTSGGGGRSLFGRVTLGGILGRGDSDQGDASPSFNASHPMPYDPAAVTGDRRQAGSGSAAQQQRSGPSSRQRGQQAPSGGFNASAVERQQQPGTPNSSATRQRQTATAQNGRQAEPPEQDGQPARETTSVATRMPRRSPTTGVERGRRELDEAVADLQSAAPSPSGDSSRAVAGEGADAIPDYLEALDALAEPSRPNTDAPGPAPRATRGTGKVTVSPDTVDFGRVLSQRSGTRRSTSPESPATTEPAAPAAVPARIPDPAGGAPHRVATAQANGRTGSAGPRSASVAGAETEDLGALLGAAPTKAQANPTPVNQAPAVPTEQPRSEAIAEPVAVAPLTPAEPTPVVAVETTSKSRVPVLFTSRQPVIVSRVEGPQQLTVGRPATYRIVLENLGQVGAAEMLATITVPDSAELLDATATAGAIEQIDGGDGAEQILHWEMNELAAGEAATMDLNLTPRSGANLALGVRFSHAPVGSDAIVQVKEPLLTMSLQGPEVVQFGVAQRFKLVLANPGTGPAEDVQLELLPPGGDEAAKIRHGVGTVLPGETKELELELTAREAGQLEMAASATAIGDIAAGATKTIHCVKPELAIDWRGPEEKYSGAVATYYLRIRNPGEAATDAVAVGVQLPEGAELVSASDGYAPGPDKNSIAWHGAALQPGEERYLQFKCKLAKPGVNQIGLRAETPSGLTDQATAQTSIIAVADLKLEIADPKGPVPVGESVVYEIRVRNRGAMAARGVSIVGLFSAGIDPTAVEGGKHTVRDGRVAFRAIDSLAAGEEVVLKIQAQAHEEGSHVFRAEVLCQDLETKLSAEEMTRFFIEDNPWDSAATAYGEDAPTRR